MSLRKEEILFGKIALKKGFLSKEELNQALRKQKEEENPPPIGEILLNADAISEEQHERVLRLQKRNLEKFDELTEKKKKDNLFGKRAVEQGYIDRDTLEDVLKKQDLLAEKGKRLRLGEMLVQEGLLTTEQAHELLEEQDKRIMSCQECDKKYNVALPPRTEEKLKCENCGGNLRKVDRETFPSADDTVGLPSDEDSVRDQRQKDETVKETSDTTDADRREFVCVICDKQFESDASGQNRVECPNCGTTFSVD